MLEESVAIKSTDVHFYYGKSYMGQSLRIPKEAQNVLCCWPAVAAFLGVYA